MLISKATGEDANGILACLSAAFEEYRYSYTSGAFADTVLTPETIKMRFEMNGVLRQVRNGSAGPCELIVIGGCT
jgi:hypothetical protein